MGIKITRNIYKPMQDITLAADKHLVLPLHNDATTPTLAFGDGDTGFYEASDDLIRISIGGSLKWEMSDAAYGSYSGGGGRVAQSGASATVPSLMSDRNDGDTGMGHAAADQLSLIAGGIEGLRVSEANGVVNMDIVCHEGAVVTHNDNVVTLN